MVRNNLKHTSIKPNDQKKILLLEKSIDGGTGAFIFGMLKFPKYFKKNEIVLKSLVLEKPSYRKVNTDSLIFFANKNFYPNFYTPSLKRVFYFVKELVWLKKYINEFRPDIVLCIDIHCTFLAGILKQIFNYNFKIISAIHNNLAETLIAKSALPLHPILLQLSSYFLKRADKVVCVSKTLSKSIYHHFNLKELPLTIYTGPSYRKYRKPNYTRRTKTIIAIARFVEQKDHITLIKAFDKVQKQLPNSQLWLIGNGPLKNQITKKIRLLNLTNKVKFFGWVQNPIKLLRRSDIFVLSSKREGLPLSLNEAMSQGLPVIASNCPYGPSEILQNGKYGILTKVGDANDLANAMLSLLKNKKKYKHYSVKGYKRSEQFSENTMLLNFKKLINSLLPQ